MAMGNRSHHCVSRLVAAQPDPIEDQELEGEHIRADHLENMLSRSSLANAGQGCPSKKAMHTNWVPHPRNGIYFPQGYEWVMDDVPNNAAFLGETQTYWLRNVDGAEKHDPDIPSADHYLILSPQHV